MMSLGSITKKFINIQIIDGHVMHITNCCLMTQYFSSIKGKKALSFTGYFAL